MKNIFTYRICLLGFLFFQFYALCGQNQLENDRLMVSSYVEGPHIKFIAKQKVEVFYVQHDSASNHTKLISKTYRFQNDRLVFKGFAGRDTSTYIIPRKIKAEKGIFDMPDRIVVLGDIHGELHAFQNLLMNNGVMDEKGNWIYGDGHLVLTGDVFDRGDKVTECLWLIFKLEQQAREQGGKVHYILGNHESMIMLYDDRYIADKYRHSCQFLQKHYAELYSKHSVLGRWLRTKNALVRIGKQLFVHGGISPKLLEKRWSIKEINSQLRYHLNNYHALEDTSLVNLVLFRESPLWYRGYILKTPTYNRVSYRKVIETLHFYNAMAIIFGHTPVAKVYPFYSFKLIAMDVPIGDPKYIDQALLIENQKYYRIFADREKEQLK